MEDVIFIAMFLNVIMIMVIVCNYVLVRIQNVIGHYSQMMNVMKDVIMNIAQCIHGNLILLIKERWQRLFSVLYATSI